MIWQQPVAQGVLDEVLVAVLALIALLALVVVVSRIRIHHDTVRTRERLAPLRPDLLAVAAGEDACGDARRRLVNDRSAGPALDRAVVDLLTKVRGEPAEALVTVLRERNGVRKALDSLQARSSVRRARATRMLGLLQDPAHVTDIVRMLGDSSGEVRTVAARAVGGLGPRAGSSAASAVLRAVRSRRSAPGVPATVAMGTLTQLGVEAEAAVALGLEDPDPGVRNVAAAVAGHSLFLSCAPRLADLAATDPDRTVRVSATEALGAVGRPGDVRAISRLLAPHEPPTVRGAAARALGELGGVDAVEVLIGILADDDRFLAVTAANALAQSGDGRGALAFAAADPDTAEAARSAVTGVLQVLELRDATRGAR